VLPVTVGVRPNQRDQAEDLVHEGPRSCTGPRLSGHMIESPGPLRSGPGQPCKVNFTPAAGTRRLLGGCESWILTRYEGPGQGGFEIDQSSSNTPRVFGRPIYQHDPIRTKGTGGKHPRSQSPIFLVYALVRCRSSGPRRVCAKFDQGQNTSTPGRWTNGNRVVTTPAASTSTPSSFCFSHP